MTGGLRRLLEPAVGAGLLVRFYAMIESGGKTEIVQPGQTLNEKPAGIVSIETNQPNRKQ